MVQKEQCVNGNWRNNQRTRSITMSIILEKCSCCSFVFCVYRYISCITKYPMSALSRERWMPTDMNDSGKCAPDVGLPWLHAYPEDQKSTGVAFCQLQRCKICKEREEEDKKGRGIKINKERTSRKRRPVQTDWHLFPHTCLQPPRLTLLDVCQCVW